MAEVRDKPPRRIFFAVCAGLILLILLPTMTVFMWRVHLDGEVNVRIRALKAAGYPTSGTELDAWYETVPDHQNAALKLMEAFAFMRSYPDERSNEVVHLKRPGRAEPLTSDQRDLLAGHVQLNVDALAKAKEAIVLPRSRYPVNLAAGPRAEFPHLAKLKILARTADDAARLAVDAGKAADAAQAIDIILGVTRTLDDEPVVISQLVRAAVVNMAVSSLERSLAVSGFSDADLSSLSTAFAQTEKANLMMRALVGERAMAISHFRISRAEIERLGRMDPESSEFKNSPPLPGPQPLIVRVTGFFERDLEFYLRAMETNIALASLPPPRSLAATNVAEQYALEAKRKYYILSGLSLPSLSRVTVRGADSVARLRAAQAALALEHFRLAHGRLPGALAELVPEFLPLVPVDPFDGAHLRYKRLAKGYVVYSVGADERDDDGKEAPAGTSRSAAVPQDITITVER